MTTYEYKTLSYPLKRGLLTQRKGLDRQSLTRELNLLGSEGWELTGQFTEVSDGFSRRVVMILKRPILDNFHNEEE